MAAQRIFEAEHHGYLSVNGGRTAERLSVPTRIDVPEVEHIVRGEMAKWFGAVDAEAPLYGKVVRQANPQYAHVSFAIWLTDTNEELRINFCGYGADGWLGIDLHSSQIKSNPLHALRDSIAQAERMGPEWVEMILHLFHSDLEAEYAHISWVSHGTPEAK